MKLEAHEITATSARMEWRHLDEQEEKPHVDGVQVLKKVKDLEANKSNLYVLPASPYPAGHQWNSRISCSRGSLIIYTEEPLLAILPSRHPDQLKITFHLADIALHSPGHQLLCVGGASGGGLPVKQ